MIIFISTNRDPFVSDPPRPITSSQVLGVDSLLLLRISMQINHPTILHINLSLIHCHIIFITEDGRYFFKGQSVGVRKPDPDNNATDRTRDNKYEIELPPNVEEGSRSSL